MEDKQRIELIVTVVDSDSTDLVVRAAKEAGAHGGTVIKAREISSDDQEKKIFGMTVQPEKEIVLMLVPEEKKAAIFKAACAAVLEHTGEHALAFTMPVSDTGAVSRSCSVRVRRSSAKAFMVRRGIITMYANIRNWK